MWGSQRMKLSTHFHLLPRSALSQALFHASYITNGMVIRYKDNWILIWYFTKIILFVSSFICLKLPVILFSWLKTFVKHQIGIRLGSVICGALPPGLLQALKACCLDTGKTDLNSGTQKPMYVYNYSTTTLEVLALFSFYCLFEKQYIQKKMSTKQISLTQN